MRRAVVVVAVLLIGGVVRSEEKKTSLPSLPIHQLIANAAVQEELALKDDQKKALEDAASEAREALKGVNKLEQQERQKKQREVREKVQGVVEKQLKEDQLKRLREIDLQQRGALAVTGREVAQKLTITPEQRAKLRDINQELTKSVQKLREDNKGAELNEKIGTARGDAATKAAEVLTDEQKKAWKEMLGKPFDIAKLQPRR